MQPDVSLALDPEWRVQPGQVPGRVIGKVSVGEINQVSQYLSDLVVANDLPQKLLLVHEFRTWQIQPKPAAVQHRPGIAFVWHVDGFGGQAAKLRTYQALALPPPAIMGFKLFYKQDTHLMTPAQVLALNPPRPTSPTSSRSWRSARWSPVADPPRLVRLPDQPGVPGVLPHRRAGGLPAARPRHGLARPGERGLRGVRRGPPGVERRWVSRPSIYWYVAGEHYLGSLVVRHELTDELLAVGGHVGYHIGRSVARAGPRDPDAG